MARVLILYATVEGQTARIAGCVAERLRAAGHGVELRDAAGGADPAAHDAVIVGASVHYGHHPGWLRKALAHSRAALAGRRTAFFSVSLSVNPDYARDFLRRVGWQPDLVATFTGALKYRQYAWWKRQLVQVFARMGGHDTDTSRDHEYTDWTSVAHFADAFAGRLCPRA